jgi:hypothetical protein
MAGFNQLVIEDNLLIVALNQSVAGIKTPLKQINVLNFHYNPLKTH